MTYKLVYKIENNEVELLNLDLEFARGHRIYLLNQGIKPVDLIEEKNGF